MTTATSQWNNETGFWQVTDEYGAIWDVVTTSDQSMLLVREDSQRFYGALWTGHSGHGEIVREYHDGEEADGFDCNQRYRFDPNNGWTEVS